MASNKLPDAAEAARQLDLHVTSGELTTDQ